MASGFPLPSFPSLPFLCNVCSVSSWKQPAFSQGRRSVGVGELKEEEQRWTVGLPYLTSCVRDRFHPKGSCLSFCVSVRMFSSYSFSLSITKTMLFLQISLFPLLTADLPSLTPFFKCRLFFTLSLSYLLSSLCAWPSLPLCPPPIPSCFPHSVHVSLPCG